MRKFLAFPVSPFFFWLLLSGPAGDLLAPGHLDAQERSYQEMRAEVVQLYGEERFAEAANILSGALERYPDHLMANCVNLALMNLRLETFDKALEALGYGLDHGIWYGKYTFLDPAWDPLKGVEGWEAFEGRNQKAKDTAAKEVKPRLEVVLPENYDPSREYPLFLALHGGGENVDLFMPNWGSPVLAREFIVAFPQSTQLIAMDGYNWTEDIQLSLEEIGEAYEQVSARYPVDQGQIFVGGFSSGGVASLEVVLNGTLPVRGFVVLCPAMPEDFSPELVREASERGVRGTLLTTEMDGRLDQQRRMADVMNEVGLPLEFHITPDIGHWYPEDLAARIDRAIAHIRGDV
jgi:predicted esterase